MSYCRKHNREYKTYCLTCAIELEAHRPSGPAIDSKDFSWIRAALNAGGILTVKSTMTGKTIFSARMKWPGENDVVGNISTRVCDALRNLDGALMDDAAKEMQDSGGA